MSKIKSIFIGRYGTDQLNMTLLVIALILSVITAFTSYKELTIICWIPLLFYVYRSFSKKHILRYKENALFMKIVNPIIKPFYIKTARLKDKNHLYCNCPSCSQTIRVEKQKGKVSISCPMCKSQFIK
jgi:predicted membrane protein